MTLFECSAFACPVPLTVRGTQAIVSFAPLAFKLFFAARHNAVLRRSSFRPRKNVSLAPRVPMMNAIVMGDVQVLPHETQNTVYRYLIAISKLRLGILTEQGECS
jgi:hypothetical protein